MALQIIGASYGRTGTTSLMRAIEILGFRKVLHMENLRSNVLAARRWYRVSRGSPPNWPKLLRGYAATLDWPGCSFYRELAEAFPDAKLILTVRDPDSWLESMSQTVFRQRALMPRWMVWLPGPRYAVGLIDNLVLARSLHGADPEDSESVKRAYIEHVEQVKRSIHPDRLLVYDVRDGWDPLCKFLGKAVPSVDFPHLNDRHSFQSGNDRRIYLFKTGLASAAAIFLTVVWLVFAA